MSDDARDIYLVEDYLQRRRDAISNFLNLSERSH